MGYITYPRTSGRGSDEKKALEAIRLIENLLKSFSEIGLNELLSLLSLIDWSKLSGATKRKLLSLLRRLFTNLYSLNSKELILKKRYWEVKKKKERQAFLKSLADIALKISNYDKITMEDFSNSINDSYAEKKRYYDFDVWMFHTSNPIELLDNRNIFLYTSNSVNFFVPYSLKVLYRSMSLQEYQEVISTHKWSALPDTMEGKWFAETYQDARVWGNKIEYSTCSFMIVQVTVPDKIAKEMYCENALDAKALTRFAQLEQLNKYARITWAKEEKAD